MYRNSLFTLDMAKIFQCWTNVHRVIHEMTGPAIYLLFDQPIKNLGIY